MNINQEKRHIHQHTSKYIGVSWRSDEGKWVAQITINGEHHSLGRFTSEEEASNAYQDALRNGGPAYKKPLTSIEKVLANIQISETGCWLWKRWTDKDGYARMRIERKRVLLHRWMYQYHKGNIPEGLVIDHLCRVRHCLNPDHLEVVTIRENTLRGETHPARNAMKTHCPKGHPYNSENTKIKKRSRICLICMKEQNREQRLRSKIRRIVE